MTYAHPAPPPTAGPPGPSGPVEGVDYAHLHRLGRPGRWRPILGTLAIAITTFVLAQFLVAVPFVLWYTATGADAAASFERLIDFSDITPAGLAYLNLSLATAIPAAFVIQRVLHGLKPGTLASVRPRLRWGFFGVCLLLALVALFATVVVSQFLPDGGDGGLGGGLNPWSDRVRDFLLVILLLTPLQAAGEEYLFRGYLTQAVGGLFGSRVVAVTVPAVLFALAHGLGQEWPVFFDRLAFGLVAGVLVLVTGGLEAGIAMHVLNNFLAFGLALAFGDLSDTLTATQGTWWMIPSTLTQSIVYLALAWWVARAMGVATRTRGVLAGSGGRV